MNRTRRLFIPLALVLAFFASISQLSFAAAREQTTTLTTTVRHGGNIRATPSLQGAIVGQVNFNEVVTLLEKTSKGSWYHIVAPAAEGWVSVTLLTMPRTIASQVPVQGAARVAQVPGASTVSVYNGGNVRNNHGPTGAVIDQINARETVQVLAKCNQNVWIKIINLRGTMGWVHKSLLNIDQALIDKLPIE